MISWLSCENSRIQFFSCGIKSAILVIRFPVVCVSCGITPNITKPITLTSNIIVRNKLTGLANFLANLLFSFVFPRIIFSKKLIGTLITNAIAPPSAKGNMIFHISFSASITTSNFHKATTSSAVNTISSRTFFIDILLKFTISPHFF